MTFEQFKALAQQASRVAVSKEIFGDTLTAINVFRMLGKNERDAVLLDSSDHKSAEDACVYMGFNPIAKFERLTSQKCTANIIDELRNFYHQYRCASLKTLAKFAGGMIGFFGYDAVRFFEEIPEQHEFNNGVPDVLFQFYATTVVFDKRSGKVTIAHITKVSADLEKDYEKATAKIDQIIKKIHRHPSKEKLENFGAVAEKVTDDIDDKKFIDMVQQAKKHVAKGDVFQVVLSRRFQRPFTGDDFNIYRALRLLNPSPYQFYLRHGDFTIVGASPERFVSIQNGMVETMPIAGTCPRGKNHEEDLALENKLINDEKERAEHMMLVDLGRNDVGAVAEPGTVKLIELAKIHKYSRVMHIVSRVQGKLPENKDCFDVLKATFPAGTLSGAPKIRAMQIIDEIETSRRGFYGGAVIAIDNAGQLDSCITIRSTLIKDKIATVRAGAGIVMDSNPQLEADETRHKARAVLEALALAERGFL